MRTTLDLDPDVLLAAKELARREGKTAGAVVSELSRRALAGLTAPGAKKSGKSASGFRPFAPRGGVVTNARVDELREESGI